MTRILAVNTSPRASGRDLAVAASKLPTVASLLGYIETHSCLTRSRLSNSEVYLLAAIWEAQKAGVHVDYVPVCEPSYGARLGECRRECDGLLLGGPVYFGDRSSLAETFLRALPDGNGRPFAAVACGAKRNGGQETSLVYQMMDALAAGWTVVGNDAATTSQYGGTGVAGDVGSARRDGYGLDTSRGTGRRLAAVASTLAGTAKARPRVLALVLADDEGAALDVARTVTDGLDAEIIDLTAADIRRCIACDLCPTEHGPDEDYRCIIAAKGDWLAQNHGRLLGADLIIPIVYDSPRAVSVYQRFLERSRYIRRSDYILRGAVVCPVVLYDAGRIGVMHLRMSTAWMRHNTVISRAGVVMRGGDVLRAAHAVAEAHHVARNMAAAPRADVTYSAVGYGISKARDAREGRV